MRLIISICILAIVSSCAKQEAQIQDIALQKTAVQETEYVLSWSDEFNGNELDRSKWNVEKGYLRNRLSYYTTDGSNWDVRNGSLHLIAKKNDTEPKYTSASLMTRGLKTFKYGRFEMRAKMPSGKGFLVGFWTTGDNYAEVKWPECGEIDVFEYVGAFPGVVHGTVHYKEDNNHSLRKGTHIDKKVEDGYHIFAIEWTEEKIEWFYDGTKYYSINVDDIGDYPESFRKPHILRISFPWGGNWLGDIDDSVFPQDVVIDYVRVYEKKRNPVTAHLQSVYWLLLLKD